MGARGAAGDPVPGAVRAVEHPDKHRHRDARDPGLPIPHPHRPSHGPLRRARGFHRSHARTDHPGAVYRAYRRVFRGASFLGVLSGARWQLVRGRGSLCQQVVPAAHAGSGVGHLRHGEHRVGDRSLRCACRSRLLRLAVGVLGVHLTARGHGGSLLVPRARRPFNGAAAVGDGRHLPIPQGGHALGLKPLLLPDLWWVRGVGDLPAQAPRRPLRVHPDGRWAAGCGVRGACDAGPPRRWLAGGPHRGLADARDRSSLSSP